MFIALNSNLLALPRYISGGKEAETDKVPFQRDKAWEIFPYPCIGQFRFLDLSISQSPHYSDILSRLKSGEETFLDLGCCFGQDLRKLVSDGAPSEHLYGSDLRQDFWDLGYELFQDGRALKSRFLAADIFDENSSLQELDGKVDILYASSFLHLFNLELQHNICERIVRLLKPKAGSILLGRQVGHVEAGEKIHRTNKGGKMWRHNVQSFEKMWREVGDLTGTKWKVEAVLYDLEKDLEGDPGMRRIRFAVFRE